MGGGVVATLSFHFSRNSPWSRYLLYGAHHQPMGNLVVAHTVHPSSSGMRRGCSPSLRHRLLREKSCTSNRRHEGVFETIKISNIKCYIDQGGLTLDWVRA